MQKVWSLFLYVCFKAKSNLWFLDNRCSRHMTRDDSMFTRFQKKKRSGKVTIRDNWHENILSIYKISKSPISSIENVYLTNGLKYILLNISQHFNKGNWVCFDDSQCVVENTISHDIVLYGFRLDNVYAVHLDYISAMPLSCLQLSLDDAWFWHQMLGHAYSL